MDIQTELESKFRDELTIIARKLKIAGYHSLNKDDLISKILEYDEQQVRQILQVTWWDRYHNHFYGVVSVVALLLSVIFFIVPYFSEDDSAYSDVKAGKPTKMAGGQFNIAIAKFGVIDEQGKISDQPDAEEISQSIANYLTAQKENLTQILGEKVSVWGPENGLALIEPDQEFKYVQDINADVLVYGSIEIIENDKWLLSPKFYLTDDAIGLADELRGEHALGKPIVYSPNATASTSEVNTAMQVRLEALSGILVGLSYLTLGTVEQYERAAMQFQNLVDTSKWAVANDNSGQEILHLFLGNALLMQTSVPEMDSDDAARLLIESINNYAYSLELNPTYSRASNGLGAAYFARAFWMQDEYDCDWDESEAKELLGKSKQSFEDALNFSAMHKPKSGYVDLRAHFGLLKAHHWYGWCFEEEFESWYDALDEGLIVLEHLDSLEPNSGPLKELAASAYSILGSIELFAGELSESVKYYESALDYYEQAGTTPASLQRVETIPYYLLALCWDKQSDKAQNALNGFMAEEHFNNKSKAKILDTISQEDSDIVGTCISNH